MAYASRCWLGWGCQPAQHMQPHTLANARIVRAPGGLGVAQLSQQPAARTSGDRVGNGRPENASERRVNFVRPSNSGRESPAVERPNGTYVFAYDNMGRLIGTATQYSFLPGHVYNNLYTYDAA